MGSLTDRQLIYLSSANRNNQAGTSADFTIGLPLDKPLQGAGGHSYKVYLSQVVLRNAFNDVTTKTGAFQFSVSGGAPELLHLPLGTLDARRLTEYFLDKCNIHAYFENGAIVLLNDTATFSITQPTGSRIGEILGLDPTLTTWPATAVTNTTGELTGLGSSSVITNSTTPYRIIGKQAPALAPLLVNVRSSLISDAYEIEQKKAAAIGVSTIMASIPNRASANETLVWSDPQGAGGTLLASTAELNTVRFWLTDEFGNTLKPAFDWYATLNLDKYRDDSQRVSNMLSAQTSALQEQVRLQRLQVVQRQLKRRKIL